MSDWQTTVVFIAILIAIAELMMVRRSVDKYGEALRQIAQALKSYTEVYAQDTDGVRAAGDSIKPILTGAGRRTKLDPPSGLIELIFEELVEIRGCLERERGKDQPEWKAR